MNKTILQSALAVILMLLLPTVASGYDFEADGIYYNVKEGQAEKEPMLFFARMVLK